MFCLLAPSGCALQSHACNLLMFINCQVASHKTTECGKLSTTLGRIQGSGFFMFTQVFWQPFECWSVCLQVWSADVFVSACFLIHASISASVANLQVFGRPLYKWMCCAVLSVFITDPYLLLAAVDTPPRIVLGHVLWKLDALHGILHYIGYLLSIIKSACQIITYHCDLSLW